MKRAQRDAAAHAGIAAFVSRPDGAAPCEDLRLLVNAVPDSLVEAEPLTRWPARDSARSSWRLRFAGGRTLKGRCFESAAHAARARQLMGCLDARDLAPVVAWRGAATLEEWIDGNTLADAALEPELLRCCGELHGRIHTASPPAAADGLRWAAEPRWAALSNGLNRLVRARVTDEPLRARLLDLAASAAPHDAAGGIAHTDLCAENLVLRPTGELVSIDNESIRIDALDYDLARTWYRWPLSAPQRRHYLEGYERYRSTSEFEAHRLYWTVLVLVDSALWHARLRTGGLPVPVRRLNELVRTSS